MNQVINKDCLEALREMPDNSIDSIITDPPAGIGFMGKEWDSNKGGRKQWTTWLTSIMMECLRVLKPGGHMLIWAIPKTSHWTACAVEDAGFEIRDCVYHVFGSGFPKSLDISKAIDKEAGVERKVVGSRNNGVGSDSKSNIYVINNGKSSMSKVVPITAPSTPQAIQWQGYGTSLKPAVECWWLCRKPIAEKTIASNVLKWGTGGINIDACRIPTSDKLSFGSREIGNGIKYGKCTPTTEGVQNTLGRFPSHLILDEEAGKLMDEQSGFTKSSDASGASRFFYCAKASKSERNAGCESITPKNNMRVNAPRESEDDKHSTRHGNFHPTIKPLKLMEYLITLVTPKGGIVLDPFAGSGSTLVAAAKLGFSYVGIEQEQEYVQIINARLGALDGQG